MSPRDSLALLLDIGLSVEDWKKLKSATDEHLKPANMSLFPNYERVAEAKNTIIDKKLVEEKQVLTSTVMTLPMDTVANNTLFQWVEDPEVAAILEKINAEASPDNKATVVQESKSGQDGSNSNSNYNQRDEEGEDIDDSKLLGSSFTHINLTHVKEDGSRKIIAKNELCNSSYSCWPLWCVNYDIIFV